MPLSTYTVLVMAKIAIIGGGASGLMATARIVEVSNEHEVFLIERNDILGKKVIISGGGRCNVTTGLDDLKELLKKYPRGARFLRTAIYAFPPFAMREWMESQGVPLKIEEDLRVFPKSDDGKQVVKVFEKIIGKYGISVLFNSALKDLARDGDEFVLSFEDSKELRVDKVILCSGGQAYRHTGSKGDGYGFAEALGHSITKLGPSLNAFLSADTWTRVLSGLSFKNITLTFHGEEKFSFTGPMMFTHKGLTGPAVFAISAYAAYEIFDKNKPVQLNLDLFPAQNHEELHDSFKEKLDANQKKTFQNVLGYLVPKTFGGALCAKLDIDPSKLCCELSKKDLNKVISALKNLPLTIVGRAAGDEFVTAGGVELSEVDPKTMESKLCPSLYFAGEILDYDGFTGGFNLQAAWATGRLAGEAAAG